MPRLFHSLFAWGPLWAAVGLWGTVSCTGSHGISDERADWLRSTLFEDHQDLWLRDPQQVALKFEKMTRDPYRYLRGTLPQYLRDSVEEGRDATGFVSLESSQILLMGDPHLENFGTYLSSAGAWVMELNDFDAAQYGPFHFDLRRFATSVFVAQRHIVASDTNSSYAATPSEMEKSFVEFAVRAYVDEILRLGTEEDDGQSASSDVPSPWMQDIFNLALQREETQHALHKWTETASQGRRFKKRSPEEVPFLLAEEDALMDVTPEEKVQLLHDFRTYPASLWGADWERDLPVMDIARRYGAGVSSMPLYRFYVLLDGASLGEGEDVILEFKEARDPFLLANVPSSPLRAFRQNAERVVESQRRLQCEPGLDGWLGYTQGENGHRVRHVSAGQVGVDVNAMREAYLEGIMHSDEVQAFVADLARVLARAHARGNTISGASSLAAILGSISDNPDGLIAETTAFALRYGMRTFSDFEIYQKLVEAHGYDLGFPSLTP